MNDGDKVCLALDMANVDRGTIIGRAGIHKVRVLWEDGEETEEKVDDLKVVEVNNWANMGGSS
jgi:predicted RNA-binding protein YlqC (UPF0109 family)